MSRKEKLKKLEHSFDVDIAKEYGIIEAILLKNLWFWIEKNRANSKNFHDGRYWTYNSTKAFNELFPYASESTIKRALKKLQEKGLIQTGNYNKLSYDRTLWYAFTNLGYSIVSNRTMENVKSYNGNVQNGLTIPDNKPDINKDIYFILFNKYKEKIKNEPRKKIKIITDLQKDEQYQLLTLEQQDEIFTELMKP